jgi:hypothetical protein
MTKLLVLANGLVTLVDDDTYEWARHFKWSGGYGPTSQYAKRFWKENGRIVGEFLHRCILTVPQGLEVDHINGDPLDNRRANLRFVTRSQNEQNKKRARADSSIGIRGVERRCRNTYGAIVQVDGRRFRRGPFETPEEAGVVAAELRRQLMTHAPECSGGLW